MQLRCFLSNGRRLALLGLIFIHSHAVDSLFAGPLKIGLSEQKMNVIPAELKPSMFRSSPDWEATMPGVGVQALGLVERLYGDVGFMANEPDFYLVVGGLALAPLVFETPFRRETAEITELWGPSTFADRLFEVGEMAGDGLFPVIVAATCWNYGKLTGSARMSAFGVDLFRVQVVNGLLTSVLKAGIHRTRPDGTAYSYPSGHTSTAFATAGAVYGHWGRAWGIPAYILATYVGVSRLQEGKHFVSDIFAGGILGTYISRKLIKRGEQTGPITVAPQRIGAGIGLSVSYRF